MKKKSLIIIILFWISCLLMSCAGSKSIPAKLIPEGSQSLGVYEGAFRGDMSKGSILIHLFQTPEGDKLFRATVDVKDAPFIENKVLFVRGKMTANSLEGEFQGDASGTIGGQLSPDDNQLTGSFIITAPGLSDGTWLAEKLIPEGSQYVGFYYGDLEGKVYGGTIQFKLFQTPEGDKLFRATVDVKDAPFIENKVLFVRGKMTANSLEGEFQGDASGTIGGQLSPDDNQLTGSFIITAPGFLNYGTWKTTKIRNLGGSVPKFITF